MRIAEIQTRLADIGAHSAPARAAQILSGLGFSHAEQQRPCAEFSGGWRMRVALAATLFTEPDLLLLDEPTNYLDLEATLWLEQHIARYPHTVMVISHDRDLLDTCGRLDSASRSRKACALSRQLFALSCDSATNACARSQAREKSGSERQRLQAFVDRFRAKATKARQAQSRLKLLAKLDPVVTISRTGGAADRDCRNRQALLSPPIIALDDVCVGYEPGRPVLRGLTLRIDNDERIALLGANGNGKSTLVKLLAGRLAPMSGANDPCAKAASRIFRTAPAR